MEGFIILAQVGRFLQLTFKILEGFISWVGRSSMEATIRVFQETHANSKNWQKVMDAKFVMVAKHPKTNASVPVCPLELQDDDEKKIFQQGEGQMLQIFYLFVILKKYSIRLFFQYSIINNY